MEYVRRAGLIAVTAALLAWLPGQAEAQQVGVGVDGFGGIAVPTSNLGIFQDLGPSFGLGVEYEITDRVFVRGSGQVDLHTGGDAEDLDALFDAPDISLFHYTAGFGVHLVPSEVSAWDVSVSIEAGGTSVSSDDFPEGATPPEGETDFSQTYFNLSPGLRVGYLFAERYNVFFRSQPHFAFADEEETAVFAQFDDEIDDRGFEELWNLPLTAGVQVKF